MDAQVEQSCERRRHDAGLARSTRLTVGVAGPFGSVNAGWQIAPMAYAMAETDARGGQWFGSILTGGAT